MYYFEDIIIALEFLYNKNIEIEILNHEQIYIDKNNVTISPYFENNIYPLNIVYGSPIFNTLNINIKNKTDNENKIIKNISMLFIELINICLNINIEELGLGKSYCGTHLPIPFSLIGLKQGIKNVYKILKNEY